MDRYEIWYRKAIKEMRTIGAKAGACGVAAATMAGLSPSQASVEHVENMRQLVMESYNESSLQSEIEPEFEAVRYTKNSRYQILLPPVVVSGTASNAMAAPLLY